MNILVGFTDFVDAFHRMDRQDTFSYAGKRALFDYLEEYENTFAVPILLDVPMLCSDYSEYESLITAAGHYTVDKEILSSEENAREWLTDRTIVLEFTGGVILADF